ncbi:MAG: EAL domain-containing protein [Coriobacteriales bacterium]|jgi:lactose/cellobiose-specific phosphotransferase system IIC component|nr:EAL domain-containing protein [Coriobacteriales bacterium]
MPRVPETVASAFADNRYVRSISNGLVNIIPVVLIGAFATALAGLPVPPFHDFLNAMTNGYWMSATAAVKFATLEVVGLAALLSVSLELAGEDQLVKKGETNRFVVMFTAFACYVAAFVWDAPGDTVLDFPHPGRTGVFYALATALAATSLFFASARLWRRLVTNRMAWRFANLQVRSAFASIFPLAATLAAFAVARVLYVEVFEIDAASKAFGAFAQEFLISDNPLSVLGTVFLSQLLWFFGVHGTDTVISTFPSLAAGAGALPGETLFASKEFYLSFINLGGCGATLGLLAALLIVGSRQHGRRIAKASVFPSLLNVNETLLYGLPLVFNPFVLVPFVGVPLLNAALCLVAFGSGIVPPITASPGWTTPVVASGYLATGSVAGALLQGVCLAVSVLVYLPFVRWVKRRNQAIDRARFDRFKAVALDAAENEQSSLLMRRDALGDTAREFAVELHEYFDSGQLPFRLVYQPKTDAAGRVVGAEALLRWTHPEHGAVSPVVLVEMTDEAGLSVELGRWVAGVGIAELARWKALGIAPPVLSVNLNPRHLAQDPEFPAFIGSLLNKHGIAEGELELEITEHVAVRSGTTMQHLFKDLRAQGVSLSIDDMGMGYSSLTYITDYGVSSVKIDTSLVSDIADDVRQQEIVRSIVQLAGQLDLKIIVEGVETAAQVEALTAIGCRYFQGYYFSRPLEPDAFVAYVLEH